MMLFPDYSLSLLMNRSVSDASGLETEVYCNI